MMMMKKFCALLLIVQAFTIFIKPSEAYKENESNQKTCRRQCRESCAGQSAKPEPQSAKPEPHCFRKCTRFGRNPTDYCKKICIKQVA
ncbi:unnamed protein product [Trichobilharzia szidati]|nr:unnamed protein product [Trichobilharzia szidati]